MTEPLYFVSLFDPTGTMLTAGKLAEHLTLEAAQALQAQVSEKGAMALIYSEGATRPVETRPPAEIPEPETPNRWTYWKRLDFGHWPLVAGELPTISTVYRSDGSGFGATDMQVWWSSDHRWHEMGYDNSVRRTLWFGSDPIDPATEAEVAGFGVDVDDATAEPVAEVDLEPEARRKAAYAESLPIFWPLRHTNEPAARVVAEAERLGIPLPDDLDAGPLDLDPPKAPPKRKTIGTLGRLYTFGYQRHRTPEALAQLAAEHDFGIVVDVRFKPWPPQPKANVESAGLRYISEKRLGNAAYRGGGIEIADLDGGLVGILAWLRCGDSLALMCACSEPTDCHRRTITEECQRRLPDLVVIDL